MAKFISNPFQVLGVSDQEKPLTSPPPAQTIEKKVGRVIPQPPRPKKK